MSQPVIDEHDAKPSQPDGRQPLHPDVLKLGLSEFSDRHKLGNDIFRFCRVFHSRGRGFQFVVGSDPGAGRFFRFVAQLLGGLVVRSQRAAQVAGHCRLWFFSTLAKLILLAFVLIVGLSIFRVISAWGKGFQRAAAGCMAGVSRAKGIARLCLWCSQSA